MVQFSKSGDGFYLEMGSITLAELENLRQAWHVAGVDLRDFALTVGHCRKRTRVESAEGDLFGYPLVFDQDAQSASLALSLKAVGCLLAQAGEFFGRGAPNNSFKPNPLRGSA